MQVNMVKKKKHIIPYLFVLFVAFAATTRLTASAKNISIDYTARTATVGWKDTKNSSATAVSTRPSLDDSNQALDALKIKLNGEYNGGISYTVHTIEGAWLEWSKDGNVLEDAKDKSFNAIKIELYGDIAKQFNIKYRVLTSENIWSEWGTNKEEVGNTSSKFDIIDIEICLEEKDSAITALAKIVKDATTPESVLDYDDEAITASTETTPIVDESVPTSGGPATTITPELQPLNKPLKGIDVSYYNGTINWQKVKAAGINYAIIQVGYRGCTLGTLKADSQFEKNIQNAVNAGIPVGVYYVTQAKNEAEAKEEANWVLNKISNYSIQYPVYIDIEEVKNSRCRKMNNEQRTLVCKTFCDTIKAAGYQTGIYSCKYWFDSKLNTDQLKDYNIWCAVYENKNRPQTSFTHQIWQYSETGKVDGITGNVDMNYCYYDYVSYSKSLAPPSKPAPATDVEADPNAAVG